MERRGCFGDQKVDTLPGGSVVEAPKTVKMPLYMMSRTHISPNLASVIGLDEYASHSVADIISAVLAWLRTKGIRADRDRRLPLDAEARTVLRVSANDDVFLHNLSRRYLRPHYLDLPQQ